MTMASALPDRTEASGVGAIGFLLQLATYAATILISTMLLEAVGIPYGSAGGSPLTKFHPMTYLSILAFLAVALRHGNPIDFFVRAIAQFPGVGLYLFLLVFLIVWTIVIQKQPVSGPIDTFLGPGLILLVAGRLSPEQNRVLTLFVHLAMLANALVGILELGSGWRLTPFILDGKVLDWDWRSTALLGHPLVNAVVTGIYTLMLFFGADRSMGPFTRVGMILLQIAAMGAFQGRTATVLSLGIMGIATLWMLIGILRGRRFDPRVAAAVLAGIPTTIGILLTAYSLGAFDKFISRFVDDGGSANARVSMIRIYNSFPLTELLWGPDPNVLMSRSFIEGAVAGIESFIFGFFLQYGILISVVFFVGLFAYTLELWRIGGRAAIVILTYFYVVAATAASLSVKTQVLAILTILFVTVEARPSVYDPPLPGEE